MTDHILHTYDRINVIVAGKQPSPQWLDIDQAAAHCRAGIGRWGWASNEGDGDPDVVLACAGDVPTLEAVAAVALLREALPALRIRLVNVDLMALQPKEQHPHGLPEEDFTALFTHDRPVIFAFHGYPQLVHRLTYKRTNHDNFHVRGYREEGTTTTSFDMVVLNQLDRFHLAIAAIDRLPQLGADADRARRRFQERLAEHNTYIRQHGQDMPDVADWSWPSRRTG